MLRAVRFYGKCLALAFRGAWGISGAIGTIASLAVPYVQWKWPGTALAGASDLVWQLPLATLVGVFLVRLSLAPFWIYDKVAVVPEAKWEVLVVVEWAIAPYTVSLYILNRSTSANLALAFSAEVKRGTAEKLEPWGHVVNRRDGLPKYKQLRPTEFANGVLEFRPSPSPLLAPSLQQLVAASPAPPPYAAVSETLEGSLRIKDDASGHLISLPIARSQNGQRYVWTKEGVVPGAIGA